VSKLLAELTYISLLRASGTVTSVLVDSLLTYG